MLVAVAVAVAVAGGGGRMAAGCSEREENGAKADGRGTDAYKTPRAAYRRLRRGGGGGGGETKPG